jgi:CHAT domain-containing protein/tetratricopeptide (TPR) repeat protein
MYFSASVLMVALLWPLVLSVGAQSGRDRNAPPSAEAARQAEALFQKALLHFDAQEDEVARRQLQEALEMWMSSGESGKAGQAALQIAERYKQARKYDDALKYYQQTLNLKSLPGAVRANALNGVALIYAELYLHKLAERSFNQALEQARIINDLTAQTLALTGLADLYLKQGVTEKALACVTQAWQFSRQRQADVDPALLYLKGRTSQEQGDLENAKSLYEEALTIYRKAGDPAGQVKVLCAMSTLSLLASRKQAALEQAEQAVELAEKQANVAVTLADRVNASELRWRAWLSRARAERALEQKAHAVNSYFWAISQFKGMWWGAGITTETSAIAFREEAQAACEEYVALLMEEGKFRKAYEWADETKARTALNFTGARRAKPQVVDSERAATLRALARSTIQLRLQLQATGLNRKQRARLQKELEDAEYRRQEIQVQAEMAQAHDRLVWTNLVTADQMQKQMAQDRMTLAEFFLGEEQSFLWLFAGGELYYETLPPRQEIEKAVREYLEVLAAPASPLRFDKDIAKLRTEAAALFAKLFGGLSDYIKPGQRLIFVPDGLLYYLPFEALIQNDHYLIEDHEVSYTPSASMLNLLQDTNNRVENGDRMELLAVGNAIFDAKAEPGSDKSAGLSVGAQQLLAARALRLAPLPGTKDEILEIANLFPADRRKVLTGKECTEEAVKRESLRRFRRLHFATHNLIDENSPLRSAMVLTPGDEAQEDGLLEVSEIASLELDCDLVVVSACKTGRGQLLSGEGILGLSRAFLYAGARSVVVSLWNISDMSTAQLMKSFYQNQTAGQSNAAALRAAKLQLLRSSKGVRHPYYWSSFVLVGKP